MKVFVTGATGVLGSRTVPLLIAAGHEVTATARTVDKAAALKAIGASPITLDLFDAAAVRAAVAGHDAVCNLATHIPGLTAGRRAGAWEENSRIRVEGSTNLVDATLATGCQYFVQESLAFQYTDGGDRWLDEHAPLTDAPFSAAVHVAEANTRRFIDAGRRGVILRFSMFYGAGASHTEDQLRMLRMGISPLIGAPDGYQTMLHLDDAASAVVAALGAPAGIYNVCETAPGTRRQQAAAMAGAAGLPTLWMIPPWLTRLGGAAAAPLSTSQRVSNRVFRAATGWAPRYPDPVSGWSAVITPAPEPSRGVLILIRAALVFLALQAASLGLWATFAPKSFYDSFPGFSRGWVAASGPYDQHLVTDVGAFALALLLLTLVAIGSQRRAVIRTAGLAWVVSGLPHFLFHLTHRGSLGSGDYISSVGGLGLQVVLGLVVAVAAPAFRGGTVVPYVAPVDAAARASSSAA